MKTVIRRLLRLEERLVPRIDLESQRLADLLWERRRRRLEASGSFVDQFAPEPMSAVPGARRLSVPETMRLGHKRRIERSRALRGV